MSLANLGDLKTAIGEWLYRSTDAAVAARSSDFISLFEADFLIDPDMRTAEMEQVETVPIEAASVDLPDGFMDMIRLQVIGSPIGTPNIVLRYVTPSQSAELDATNANYGIAKWYTILAGQIVISPQKWAPLGASLQIAYNAFTPLADADDGVNWLLANYPNLYLYGSLLQAAAYVDDKETVAFWKSGRDEAMAKLLRAEAKRKIGAAPITIGASTRFRR